MSNSSNRSPSTGARPVLRRATSASRGTTSSSQLPTSSAPIRANISSAPPSNSSGNLLTPARLGGIGGPPGEFVGRKPSRLVDTPPAAYTPSMQAPVSSSSSVPTHGRRAPSNTGKNIGKPPAVVLGQPPAPRSSGSRLTQQNAGSKPPPTNTYEQWMANHKNQHVKAIPVYEKEEVEQQQGGVVGVDGNVGGSSSRTGNTATTKAGSGADPWEYYRSDRGNHQDIDIGRIKDFYNAAVTLDEIEESTTTTKGSRGGTKATSSSSNRQTTTQGSYPSQAPPTTTGMARRVVEDQHAIHSVLPDPHLVSKSAQPTSVAVKSGSTAPLVEATPSTTHRHVSPPQPQPSRQQLPLKTRPDTTAISNTPPPKQPATVKRDAAINSAVRFFFEETLGTGSGSSTDGAGGVSNEVGMRLEIFDTVNKIRNGEAPPPPRSSISPLAPIPINVDLIANILATKPRGTTTTHSGGGEEDRAVVETLAEDLLMLKHQQQQQDMNNNNGSSPGGMRGKRNSSGSGNHDIILASASSEEVVLTALIDVHHRLWKGLHNIVFHCVRCCSTNTPPTDVATTHHHHHHHHDSANTSPPPRPSSQQLQAGGSSSTAPPVSLLVTPVEWLFTINHLSGTMSYPRSNLYTMTPPPTTTVNSHTPAQALALFSQLRCGILELLLALMYVVMFVGGGRCEEEHDENDDEMALWWVVRFAEEITTRRNRHQRIANITATPVSAVPLTPSLTNPTAWPPGVTEGSSRMPKDGTNNKNINEVNGLVTLDVKVALSSRIEQVERLVNCLSMIPPSTSSYSYSQASTSLLGALWGGSGVGGGGHPFVDEQPTLDTTLGPHRVDAGLRKLLHTIHAATTSLLLRRAEQVSIMGKYSPEDYLLCSNTLALNPRYHSNHQRSTTNNNGKVELENALIRPSFDATIGWLQSETRTLTEEAQYLQSMLHSLQRSTTTTATNPKTTMLRSTVNEWSSCCAPVKLARCRRSTSHLLSLLESRFTVEISSSATDSTNNFSGGGAVTTIVADHHDEDDMDEDEFDISFLLHRHHGYNNNNPDGGVGVNNSNADVGGDDDDVGGDDGGPSSSAHTIIGYAAQEWAHLARSDFTPSERRELMMLCPHLPQPFQNEKANANSMALLYANSWLRQQLRKTSTSASTTFNGAPISTKVLHTIQEALSLPTHDDDDDGNLVNNNGGGYLVGTSVDITSRSAVSAILAQCHQQQQQQATTSSVIGKKKNASTFLLSAPFHPWGPSSSSVDDALSINREDVPRRGVFQECCVGIIPGRTTNSSGGERTTIKGSGGGSVDDEADQRLFSPGARPPPLTSAASEASQSSTSRTTSALVELEALNTRLRQCIPTPAKAVVSCSSGDASELELKALSTRNWRTRIREAASSAAGLDK